MHNRMLMCQTGWGRSDSFLHQNVKTSSEIPSAFHSVVTLGALHVSDGEEV
jgi:hypothetical protein